MKKLLFLLALLFPFAAHAQTAAYSGFCDQGATPATTSGLNSTNKLQGVIPYCTVTVYLDGVDQVSSASYTSGGTITGTVGQTCNATFPGGSPSGTGLVALTGTNVIAGGTAFAITPPGVGKYATAPTTATLSNGTATCSGTATVVTALVPIKATIYKDSANTPQTNPYQTLANGQILFFVTAGIGYDIVKSGGIPPLVYTTPLTVTDWIVPLGGGTGSSIVSSSTVSCTPLVSGKCIGNVTLATVPGSALALQQYGTSAPNQAVLNAGNAIQPDPGMTPVQWKDDSAGNWLGQYIAPSGGFGPTMIPPRDDMASVIIRFANGFAVNTNNCGKGTFGASIPCVIYTPAGICTTGSTGPCTFSPGNGVQITRTGNNGLGTQINTVTWSNPILPAGFNPASVLHVYAVIVAGATSTQPSAANIFECHSGAQTAVFSVPGGDQSFPLTTYSNEVGGDPSTFNWSTATCELQNFNSIGTFGNQQVDIDQIALVAYYAGTPNPATPAVINFVPPLYYNAGPSLIGITLPYNYGVDTGAVNYLAVVIPTIPTAGGQDFWVAPANTTTVTNPQMAYNALPPTVITKCGGAALAIGDIVIGTDAHMEISGAQLNLENPISGCAGGGGGSGTVNSGTAGQVAYYASTGTVVSGTNALPNGTTATTQTTGDNTTKVATDAFVIANGGSGTFTTLSGDATSTSTGGATTVVGLKGVPFCTGFTPTNLQYLQYTTASSPNPCYTAATGSGGSLSGMTAGQIPVAATASTVTSSKALAGAGAGITTGPTTTTSGNCVEFTGTAGQIADNGSPCGSGGSGVPSVNGITGAVTVAAGTNVTVGTVGSTITINSTGGGGISYPTGDVSILSDSRFIVSYSCQVSAADHDVFSTSTVTGTGPYTFTATLPGTNTHTTGDVVTLSGITAAGFTALNGQDVTLLATPTSSSYTAIVTGVTAGTSGSGTDACTYSMPQQLLRQPSMAGISLINLTVPGGTAAAVAGSPGSYIPTVTGPNHAIVIQLGSDDCLGPCSLSAMGPQLQTIWAYARSHGYTKIVASTLIPTSSTIYNYDSQLNEAQINAWLIAQAKSSLNSSTGYFDTLDNLAAVLPFEGDTNFFMNYGAGICATTPCEDNHLMDAGNAIAASNTAIAITALEGTITPTPSSAGNGVLSLFSQDGTSAFSFVADNYSGNPNDCVYGYLANGWSGSYSSSYVQGPVFCMNSQVSDQALIQMNAKVGLASGPSSFYLNTPDIVMQRSQTFPNTWVMSGSAADAKAGTPSGDLSLGNLRFNGTLIGLIPPVPNMAELFGGNNFMGQQVISPTAPTQTPLVITGTSINTAPTFLYEYAYGNAATGGTIPYTVAVGDAVLIVCQRLSVGTLNNDSLGNTFSLLAYEPTSTEELFGSYVTNAGTGSVNDNTHCTNNTGLYTAHNVSPSLLDGTATTANAPSAGTYSLAAPPVITSTISDLLVGIFAQAGSGSETLNVSPACTLRQNPGGGSLLFGDMATSAFGSQPSCSWAISGSQGAVFSLALRGLPASGQTADLVQICAAAHTGHASCALDSTLQAGNNAQGMSYFLPIAISALPSCASGTAGTDAKVNDSLVPVIGSTVASGGSAYAAVTCNGANWTVTGK